ncbi:PREDICTED: oviduct-specific glycoprotein isoform X4 [Cercocebus atys]|uniref:oviduct-specific glycoprotein isoform X4 n=1 Tax=Cercocebus atys TaxID=9531 RepID=UPI0005F3C217|nr:PREDICTED: oviduct-specific glycoprotein isoform X4 [Cercocebus atys]
MREFGRLCATLELLGCDGPWVDCSVFLSLSCAHFSPNITFLLFLPLPPISPVSCFSSTEQNKRMWQQLPTGVEDSAHQPSLPHHRNRELKTLLSIGGWNFGTSRFTTMLSTFANREKFIASVISLLRTHDFDGLDLFFLYPGLRGSPMHDRWTFLFLIEELLFAFRKEALLTMRPRLLLSAAVSGVPHIVQTSYDVRFLGRLLDFINVLSYDLHGSWEKFTGHNSPLFSLPEDPKSSICSFVWGAKKHWIDYQYVPYANKGKEWVGYDDAISFSYKAWFIRREHFGGAMVWTLDMDDVRGTFCGTGPFPLVYVLNDILVRAEFSSTSLPQFWLSSAVNSSSTDPERLAVTNAWTTDIKILPPGGEAGVTEINGKCENMTITPRVTIVTPTKETVSLGKHTVALGEKTEITGATTMTSVGHQSMTPGEKALTPVGHQSELPGKKTLTPVGHQSVTTGPKTLISVGYHSVTPGEKTLTPVGHPSVTSVSHQSVSPGGMTMTPVHFQTETLRQNTMAPRRKAVAREKVTVSSRKISVTPEGQTVPLRGEYLTSEVGTHPQDG